MTDKVTDANIWKSIYRQHIQKHAHLLCLQACLLFPLPPNLIMSLQAAHFPQSGDWQTCPHTEKEFNMHKNNRGWHQHQILYRYYPTCLTDTTALSFHGTFFIILLYLIREECIKDLVDQLCSGCFSWSLTIFFYLCWVTNSLSSGSPPVNRTKCMVKRRRFYSAQLPDDKWRNGIMKPLAINTPQHQAMQRNKQTKLNRQNV